MTEPILENPAPAEEPGEATTSPTRPVSKVKLVLALVGIVVFWIIFDEVIIGFIGGIFTAIGWTFGAVGNTVGWVSANGTMAVGLLLVGLMVAGFIALVVWAHIHTRWGTCRNCGADGNGYRICGSCGRVK